MFDLLNSWLGILVSLGTLAGFAASALAIGWRLGRASALRDERRAILKGSLERIYGPLRVCLLNTHITTVLSRGGSPSSEVEFGRSFPMKEISEIVSANADVADPRLLNLIQGAKRSVYEYQISDEGELTPDELALAEHIWQEHERLSKRLRRGELRDKN